MLLHVHAMMTAALKKGPMHQRKRALASVVTCVLTVMAALLKLMLLQLMRGALHGVRGVGRWEHLRQERQMLGRQMQTTSPPCGRHQKNRKKPQAHPEETNSCQHGRAACCCGARAANLRLRMR